MSITNTPGLSRNDVGADHSGFTRQETGSQERRPASDSLVKAFDLQMQSQHEAKDSKDKADTNDAKDQGEAASDGDARDQPAQASLPSPFQPGPWSLFSSPSRSLIRDVTDDLSAMLTGLRVGDGSGNNRMVEMDLDNSLLPGATIRLSEAEGRLQVDFTCRDENVHLELTAKAQTMASTLGERLCRPILIRVQTDQLDDPKLVEALDP